MIKPHFLVIANNNLGHGLSGGDRIFINLIKYGQTHFRFSLLGSPEAYQLLLRYQPGPVSFIAASSPQPRQFLKLPQLIHHTFSRLISGLKTVYHLPQSPFQYVYTASDFYPDFLLGWFYKLRHPQTKWIAGYYLLAPPPFSRNSPYLINHQFIKGFLYYLGQIPTRLIVKYYADFVCVTSTPDVQNFISSRLPVSKIIVIQGGVEPVNYTRFQLSPRFIPPSKRTFDACFLGRLHPQKGVLQLIEIWHLVTQKLPQAKLAIIGNGDLQSKIESRIKELRLENNIRLFGFLDGPQKDTIFQDSKIVVHPAIFDSGGMAAAEAMAWGLPGVAFDLEALKTYYPQGMLKTPLYNLTVFAQNIMTLLTQPSVYQKYSTEALALIEKEWSWQRRFDHFYTLITLND
jgi:glycosyltransferase involved in cell wall biosynthesis